MSERDYHGYTEQEIRDFWTQMAWAVVGFVAVVLCAVLGWALS